MTVPEHPLIGAVGPLVAAIGAVVLEPADQQDSDISLVWKGEVVGAVRLDLTRSVAGMIHQVEVELGAPLSELNRETKQHAIRLLDGRGAFVVRKSGEHVAGAMGCSRITIYAYLNATRDNGGDDVTGVESAGTPGKTVA